MFDWKNPQTTIVGLVRLLVMLFAIFMFVTSKWTLLQATAITVGVNTLLGSYGFLAAKDSSSPTTISQTTVQDTDAGKVVKVETDLASNSEVK